MKVTGITLLHKIVLSAAIVCASTTNYRFDSGYGIEEINSKEKLGKAYSDLTPLKRAELASKLILLGQLLIKESRDESIAITRNQATTEEEKEESQLENLARDVNTEKFPLLKKLEDSLSQDAVVSSTRDSLPDRPRCRCRNMFKCNWTRCRGRRSDTPIVKIVAGQNIQKKSKLEFLRNELKRMK